MYDSLNSGQQCHNVGVKSETLSGMIMRKMAREMHEITPCSTSNSKASPACCSCLEHHGNQSWAGGKELGGEQQGGTEVCNV